MCNKIFELGFYQTAHPPPNLAKIHIFCIYCVEKAEIPLHVEKFEISPDLSCIEI